MTGSKAYCAKSAEGNGPPGAETLVAVVDFAIEKFGFTPDDFVLELTDGIVGDHYPMPDRCMEHNEAIVHEYMLCGRCARGTDRMRSSISTQLRVEPQLCVTSSKRSRTSDC